MPYQNYASRTTGNFLAGYANPSMPQSLAVSSNFYSAVHYGIGKAIKVKNQALQSLLTITAVSVFDILSLSIPPGVAWLHEEYHRAVLTRRKINSYNDVNKFPIGQSVINVSNLRDEDLTRLYDNHRKDFIRLQAAGIEGQYQQIQVLQRDNFFFNSDLMHVPLYWFSTINSIVYVNDSGKGDYFDKVIDEANAKETDIRERDFTGPDFTAWVEALFNPQKVYADRGTHPTGIGINRYIKPSQLTDEERNYLQNQGALQWLNILSPHLFGFTKIKLRTSGKGNYYGNFAIRHLLTSFGHNVGFDIFYQSPKINLLFTLHRYKNFNQGFWGVETHLIDKLLLNDRLRLNTRAMLWVQPKNQAFRTTEGNLGGLLGLKAMYQVGKVFPYLSLEAKTQGWVMGNVFLEENVSVNAGLQWRIK
ncbi:MAG: hypothetical protein NZ551_10035 [Microscillaceae bacterium]|nr:hypothetical protein [Microscillaceae bacterium]MDW8461535.1 hypothetical protein [Cytophagales bacterium]